MGNHITPEKAAKIRHIAQKWHLIYHFALGIGENATDDDGLAILDQHLGVDLVFLDGRYVVEFVEVVGLILGDLDLHNHPVVGGDLRRDFQ